MTRTPPAWRRVAARLLTVGFMVALVVALAAALAGQDWSVVPELLARSDPGRTAALLAAAVAVSLAGIGLGLLSWRAVLLDLGPPVSPAQVVRIFFIGFLGKYVPGKVVGVVATVRVAKSAGVTLGRLLSVAALNLGLVALTGLMVGSLAGAHLFGAQAWWLALAGLAIAVTLVHPHLLNLGMRAVGRLLRRPRPPEVSARAVRVAVVTQSAAWLVSGLHLWLLAVAMGAPPARSLPLCVGAFSLAAVLGMLAFVVPDGIGVREAVLTGALAAVLPVPAAAVVALASRVVSTVSEVALGALALAGAEVVHRWKVTGGASHGETDRDRGVRTADHRAGA